MLKLWMGKRSQGKSGCLTVVAGLLIAGLAGCGTYNEANHYNQPPPSHTYWKGAATRIATPRYYPTIMRICLPHQVGIYENPDTTSSMWILHPDPNCPK